MELILLFYGVIYLFLELKTWFLKAMLYLGDISLDFRGGNLGIFIGWGLSNRFDYDYSSLW